MLEITSRLVLHWSVGDTLFPLCALYYPPHNNKLCLNCLVCQRGLCIDCWSSLLEGEQGLTKHSSIKLGSYKIMRRKRKDTSY